MQLSELISRARRLAGLSEKKPEDIDKLVQSLAKSYGGPGPIDGAQFMPSTAKITRDGEKKSEKGKSGKKTDKVKPKEPEALPPRRRTTRSFTA